MAGGAQVLTGECVRRMHEAICCEAVTGHWIREPVAAYTGLDLLSKPFYPPSGAPLRHLTQCQSSRVNVHENVDDISSSSGLNFSPFFLLTAC